MGEIDNFAFGNGPRGTARMTQLAKICLDTLFAGPVAPPGDVCFARTRRACGVFGEPGRVTG